MRIRKGAFFSAAVALLGRILSSCPLLFEMGIFRPGITVDGFAIQGIGLNGIDLRLFIRITNPYPVAIPGAAVRGVIHFENRALTELQVPPFDVEPGGTIRVPVDLSLSYSDVEAFYRDLGDHKGLTTREDFLLRIVGLFTARLQSPVRKLPEELRVDFDRTLRIPAIVPEIRIRNFRMIDPAGSASALLGGFVNRTEEAVIRSEFDLLLKNRAARRVMFKGVRLNIVSEGEEIFSGASGDFAHEGGVSVLRVRIELPMHRVSKSFLKALVKGSVRYGLTGSVELVVPGFAKEIFRFDFSKGITMPPADEDRRSFNAS